MRVLYHPINETSKPLGEKALPFVWIVCECSIVPYFCTIGNYEQKIKELLNRPIKNSPGYPLFWLYAEDIINSKIKISFTRLAARNNYYKDLFIK